MARPQTKKALLSQSQDNFEKMSSLIDQFTPEQEQQIFSFEDRDRNVRDVLIHLYEWHQLLLNWVEENHVNRHQADFLPVPYNWRTYGDMNVQLQKKHQDTSLNDAKAMIAESHTKVMTLINQFSDEALFTKRYFPWTGTTSVGSYCVSATSSHYDWALKKLKKHQRTLKE
ncbi:ClbS/DfsB family four-helix bundle protein [Lentilactobacillus hilgardii]|uniref:ClbS/DfsB family four-helix bundle protein n=1 Tax=Lentilactobacillus hilgardii TaxID=1588 RepID=UPI0021A4C72F|nr:ClbS/DfsB family four-helix bundle protein [Lentilactobacillus hilgardii]MCT3396025.1 DfsB family protein [Lentilactobacillus hilgardii]